jgi:hypothetical protein
MIKRSSQESGSNSINIQQSQNVNIGLSYTESKELFSDLFEKNFPHFRKIAQEEAEKNIEKLSAKFADKVNGLKSFDSKILETPDFHFNLYKSIEIGARNGNEELHLFLATLLVKRIQFDKNDTKRVILNESITTIEKVSINQLKILTFSFLFFIYFKVSQSKNWQDFNEYIEEYIEPFMDYDYRLIDVQHLIYSNCSTMELGLGTPSLSQILKSAFPVLYPDFRKYSDEQKYMDEITRNNLKDHEFFFDMVDKTRLYGVSPTSVGFMLISLYFEINKGYKLPHMDELFG